MTKTDMPELLPCPFCGGTNLEVDHYKYPGVAVLCRGQGCGMKVIRYWSDSEVTVREAWSRRDDAEVQRLVAEARGRRKALEEAAATYDKMAVGEAVGLSDGGTHVPRFVSPEQFRSALLALSDTPAREVTSHVPHQWVHDEVKRIMLLIGDETLRRVEADLDTRHLIELADEIGGTLGKELGVTFDPTEPLHREYGREAEANPTLSNELRAMWVKWSEGADGDSVFATISDDVRTALSDAPARETTVQEAAQRLLEDRINGYGNRDAMMAMWDFVHKQHGRHMLPVSHYDGVFQAALRALAQGGQNDE